MRFIFTFLIAIVLVSCASRNTQSAQTYSLNGTWIPISQEMNGRSMPESFFARQRLIIEDSNYIVVAESIDRGLVRMNGNKMDIYGKEGVNKGKHFTAIYQLEKDKLSVCYNLSGNQYPDNFFTKGKPSFFMSVYTRLK